MLPRVTMPRITLGKETQHRDEQHKSLRCSCGEQHPLSASLEESVQLLHGNKAALLMVHLDSVCLQGADTALRGSGDSHKAAGAAGPSEHQDLLISAPCNCRELPAIPESFWKAQTNSFFHTLIYAFERCDSQGQAHPSLAHFPSPCEGLQQFMPQVSTAELLCNTQAVCRDLQGDEAHSRLLGTPWFTGVTAALHWSTGC